MLSKLLMLFTSCDVSPLMNQYWLTGNRVPMCPGNPGTLVTNCPVEIT